MLIDLRTKTYNYISGTCLIAEVGGAILGSLLLSHHVYFLNSLAIICYILTAWIAMLIPSHSGRDLKVIEDAVPILLPLDDPDPPYSPHQRSGLSRQDASKVSPPPKLSLV